MERPSSLSLPELFALEALVDKYSIGGVLEALANICLRKAAHCDADDPVGTKLDAAAVRISATGVVVDRLLE